MPANGRWDLIRRLKVNVPEKHPIGRGRNVTESKPFDVLILTNTN